MKMMRYPVMAVLSIFLIMGVAGCNNVKPAQSPPEDASANTSAAPSSRTPHLTGYGTNPQMNQDPVTQNARQFETSYNQAMQNRHDLSVAAMNSDYERSQELIRAYNKNIELSKKSYQTLQEIAESQGTGDITIFFPHDSAQLPENSFQYNRLIRYLDSLERNNRDRGLVFVIMGSASAEGETNHNMVLSKQRADAPIPVIDQYLVNVPHTFHKVYGTGEANSPQDQPDDINKRYRFVRIMALFSEIATPVPAAPDLPPMTLPEPQFLGGTTQVNEFTNSIGMTFRRVPAGTFMMGSPETEIRRDNNEIQHQVTLTQSFYLQTTEVTQKQWFDVMGTHPSHFKNCGTDCPVENVRYSDVTEFLKRLNQMEQTLYYRLPTEAEWEYAARAGTTTAFFNGPMVHEGDYSTNPYLDESGWYFRNSHQAPHRVALKKPNAWGFYDMHGNVWEWCSDWQRPYPFHSETDPKGADHAEAKIRRGGSWAHYPEYCRSAYRSWYDPEDTNPEMGFRVAITKLEKVKQEPPIFTSPQKAKALPVVPTPPPKPKPRPRPKLPAEPTPMPGPVKVPQCIMIRDITFNLDSSLINPRMMPLMERAVEILKQLDGKIELHGHTCSLGTQAYNMNLGLRRAEAVRDYLVSHGIDSARISVKSFGETQPKFTNQTESGRALNRRVEINVHE